MTTPREQIAIYSTQLSYSTDTSPTFLSILGDADYRIPNSVSSTDKIRWMNQAVRDVWKYTASTRWHSTDTLAGQAIYPLSTNMRFESIKAVYVSDSTARSTTELYEKYEAAGADDDLMGNKFYKAGNGFGLYPVPTSDEEMRAVKFSYEPVPAVYASTNDSTSVPNISNDYVELISYALCRKVALAGNNPDVSLANNYYEDYKELEREAKFNRAHRESKQKTRWNYRDGWWKG